MTAVAVYSLNYDYHEKVKDKEALFKDFPEFRDDKAENGFMSTWNLSDRVGDSADLAKLTEHGVQIVLHRFKGVIPYDVEKQQVGELGKSTTHIHLPNNTLVGFNEVDVLYDYCTDMLNERLKEGWRIVCVCPPLNQRRPDYIVGRNNPDAAY